MPCNTSVTDIAPSPVNLNVLSKLLFQYNKSEADFLLGGFTHGFNLHYQGPRQERMAKNLKSAASNPMVVQQKINKEITAGRVAGPFACRPLQNFVVSPIGLVPKKAPNEFRMIHHLSYPTGLSINDFIDPNLTSVNYTKFDKAVEMVQELGQGCQLFKMDIKNAFKLIPIRPQDFPLLCFYFRDSFYFDKTLPFGCSISPSTFERFTTFLEHCVKSHLSSGLLIHYLDDFLGGDKTKSSCIQLMRIFESIMHQLNVPMAPDKTEGPSEVLVFLGLELDSNEMVVRIPVDKIKEVIAKIQAIVGKDKAKVKEIQSLIGSLNFCCRAIVAGRPFCRRLINSICGLTKPFHYVRIKKSVRLDLSMWLWFFERFNGVSVFHDRFWLSNDDAEFYSDSAGGQGLGFGIFCKGQWLAAEWPDNWHHECITKEITVLEMFPILVAICIWGASLRNKRILFHCDNAAVVQILNTLTSKSDRVMDIVRIITLKSLQYNVLIRAQHVAGANNEICDALSRFQMERFRRLAPEADPEPRALPVHLWNVFGAEPSTFCDMPLPQTL